MINMSKAQVPSIVMWFIFGALVATMAVLLVNAAAPEIIKGASTFGSGFADKILRG